MRGLTVHVVPLLALCAAGCGSDSAVSLVARIEDPELRVERAALGVGLEGGFTLALDLGKYAEESATVSLGSFSITAKGDEVVSGLALEAEVGSELPLTLGPGRSTTLRLNISGTETYEAAAAEALCAGELTFRGAISSNGKPSSLESDEFSAICP
jgi:hypothetical protein